MRRRFFFEALVSSIKIATLAEQNRIYKRKNAKYNRLKSLLANLKTNYGNNCDEIFALESELSSSMEQDLREELGNMKIFERLNNEKITPYFLALAKNSQKTEDPTLICADNGNNFDNQADRDKHIFDFYERLYKNPDLGKIISVNDLEQFLGPSLLSHEVIDAKLTEHEKARLDRDLHITELDKAINESNMKSAPGMDGMNNAFIKHFWRYLRVPLLKYAKRCLETGRLTENFRTAKIRPIPKKGDKKKLVTGDL
jgi:hypothetical protein